MKAVIFSVTFFAAVFAQAAATYTCTIETQEGVEQVVMTPVDATVMKVTIGGADSLCGYDESQEVLSQINADFAANGVGVDAEILVGCEGETADASLYAIVSKSDIKAQDVPPQTNTVILNPVVGPVAIGNCVK